MCHSNSNSNSNSNLKWLRIGQPVSQRLRKAKKSAQLAAKEQVLDGRWNDGSGSRSRDVML